MSTNQEAISAIVYLILYFFILIYAAYAYIGMGLGMFRMMRSAGMRNAWMAWVPGCNIYAMGDLADHHNRVNEGRSTRYSLRLLIWHIVSLLLTPPLTLVTLLIGVTVMAESLRSLIELIGSASTDFSWDILAPLLAVFFILLAIWIAVYAVYLIHEYIALHKIYKLFAPDGAAGLTVLSILVSAAIPVIFLVLSGRTPAVAVMQSSDQAPPAAPEAPVASGQSFYSL